ncbi:MAG: 3-methyl-2-oxobutanoate hydroxymethyltransferase [Dehalococcoidia bacterium]|jgi:3-methyl-2-oxobutanoate hydroxymethyltransferase
MRVTASQIKEMKRKGEKIAEVTAYDYSMAKLVDEAGMPVILVGDSLGMVMLGYESTIPVTMDEMIHHTKAVVRGAKNALIIGDMPFMTYQVSVEDAMRNAGRFIQEGGAQAVKLEGGETVAEKVSRIVAAGIPVQGHIGLTPQAVHQLGGYKVQGKTAEVAARLLNDAKALESAGVFSIVLECVPTPLAKLITERVSVPTIGIGAGKYCDGQVQVINDLLGFYTDFVPKHAKQYAKLHESISASLSEYIAEVKAGKFPTTKQSYEMDAAVLAQIEARQ